MMVELFTFKWLFNVYQKQPGIERVQALTDILHSALCCQLVIATKPVQRLYIRQIVHN